MSHRPSPARRTVLAAAAAVALGLGAPTAAQADADDAPSAGAVFVQLNGESGNRIAAYHRAPDGKLYRTGTYGTGGLGGTTVDAPVDALASQDSLVLTNGGRTLVAVNAGSDTVTTFAANGSRLRRTAITPSGGTFPVSVAVRGDLAYVLNAGGAGSVSGFHVRGARLVPIPGSTRSLGLANAPVPTFITAPAQVGISPDGRALVVTTKANGTVLGFGLDRDGLPTTSAPRTTTSTGPVPFSFAWTGSRTLHVTQAGDGRVATYDVARDGSASARGASEPTGGAALCWILAVGDRLVAANTGSGFLSTFTTRTGVATLETADAATTGGAPIDLAASRDGRFVYVQDASAGAVRVLGVGADGRLTPVQTVTGLPVFDRTGMEGIAAS